MRPKDFVVLGILAWWLLRDREETSVGLTMNCVGPDGDVTQVPLDAQCPPGYELETGNVYQTEPVCNCITEPCNC
jgi:hypothetical protein